jgi:hypothetical protein
MRDLRSQVLWFGTPPTEEIRREYERRSLRIRVCGGGDAIEPAGACAAVFCFGSDVPAEVVTAAERNVRLFVDYGIRVDLVSSDDAATGRLQKLASEAIKVQGVVVRTDPPAYVLAEGAARHPAGRKPRMDLDVRVADNREPVRAPDIALLRRGFAQCGRITLVELTGGRSDARVFAVHMVVDNSNAGVWPQPAFAKLDRRDKIERESFNYDEFAKRFIPFGHRPNIDEKVIGATRGLLVGNFVDRSESLWDLARRNGATEAVSSLFDDALSGWRNQAYANGAIAVEGAVAAAMLNEAICEPERIKARYAEDAVLFGTAIRPDEILRQLSGLKQCYRLAPAHGDLHGENVRVRNGKAILIDMASVIEKAPLTSDFASLETWLAFQLPPDCNPDEYGDPVWSAEIDRLYRPSAFLHPPGPCEPTSRHCWMSTVVRQIRHLGLAIQSCPTEYQAAVAVHLLRRCQWDDGPAAERYRRTKGYAVAARLAADLEGKA